MSAFSSAEYLVTAITAMSKAVLELNKPIDTVLHCPQCRKQHIDRPDDDVSAHSDGRESRWDNPPHKSHLCHYCGCIWRPADVPTNGVEKIATRGKKDDWPDIPL